MNLGVHERILAVALDQQTYEQIGIHWRGVRRLHVNASCLTVTELVAFLLRHIKLAVVQM